MNTKLYNISINKPQCQQHNGHVIITDLSGGTLSFTWVDLPTTASIFDYGKSIYNIGCGLYHLKVYHILNKTTELIPIDLSCKEPVAIDLVYADEQRCYNDYTNMTVEWSGGDPPFTIQINQYIDTTDDQVYTYTIHTNTDYNVSVTDSNGCVDIKNKISVSSKPIGVSVKWEPIVSYNEPSNKVWCDIVGGQPPYKIAWSKANENLPIIINQQTIENTLKAGHYILKVIDYNDCEISKTFTINQPAPMSINILSFNDYSSKAYYPPIDTQSVYNLILIPENDINLDSNELIDAEIFIKHKNTNISQKLCIDYGNITIDNNPYIYFYISPGLNTKTNHKTKLHINSQIYDLDDNINRYSSKLLVGSLVSLNDHSFGFKNGDIISLSSQDNSIDTILPNIHITSGLYLSNNISSIFTFLYQNQLDIKALTFVNNHINSTQIQSLSTTSNSRLGSISCVASNADKNSLKALLVNEYDEHYEYSFDNKYTLNIPNIRHGKYKLKIQDQFNIAQIYNNTTINGEYFDIEILDSYETERNKSSIQSSKAFNIDSSYLNVYNCPPNKLLFPSPDFQNGVLMNISPLDACYKIIGPNTNIEDCGYKILSNLPYGKYKITVFKNNYITQTVDLFYNSHKDLVTIVLTKE